MVQHLLHLRSPSPRLARCRLESAIRDQTHEQIAFERDDRQMMGGRQSASPAKTAYIDADVATAVIARAEQRACALTNSAS
jgi:hypothetical protein